MMILSMSRSSWSESRISSSCSSPEAVRRPSSESATARGCSKISLRMNQSWPSFSAADRSQSTWYRRPSRGRPKKSVTATPERVIVTTWSCPSSSASRVYSMNAATSEPRKFSPSPSPTTSGELRRAATTREGSWASTATSVNAPSSCWQTRCIAAVRSMSDSSCSSSSCAATSVSVSETRVWSSASSRARSSAKFSMIPLCTSATRPA